MRAKGLVMALQKKSIALSLRLLLINSLNKNQKL